MRRPSRRWLAALLLPGLVALASCTIPGDSKPREISGEALPPELVDPASTDTSLPAATASRIFFLVQGDDRDGEALVAVRLEVALPPDLREIPQAVAQALIAADPQRMGRPELVNAMPSGAQVRSAELDDDNVLDLDLTNLGNVGSELTRRAVAQLVFTLTELTVPKIDAVRFSVDGTPVSVPIEGGMASAGASVDRRDDPSIRSGPAPTTTTPS